MANAAKTAGLGEHVDATVAQLLVLLDGIEERGQVFVLATTNHPEHVDAALRRPGRFHQVVWMGLLDAALGLLAAAHATDATPEPRHLLLAG